MGKTKKVQVEKEYLCIYTSDKDFSSYPLCWLRDNCRCTDCYNFTTFQRNKHLLDIPEDVFPIEIVNEKNILSITWNDGHESNYEEQFLCKSLPKNWQKQIPRTLWRGDQGRRESKMFFNKDEFLQSDDSLKMFLASLTSHGVAFVYNVIPTLEDTEKVIKRVAPIQRTLFGDMWSFTSDQARADTAYSTIPLAPHNDNTYMMEAAGLQVFHCLEFSGTGGESILVDGFYVAEELRKSDAKTFNILTTVHQQAEYKEDGWHHVNTSPIIRLNPVNQEIEQIRFNIYDRSPQQPASGDQLIAMYAALRKISKCFHCPEIQWKFQLTPGLVVFFDNWRILHGRTGFTGKRVMGGAYVGRGDWLSAARVHGLIP